MAPPSNLIKTGDKEYEAAMAKLDAEIAVSSDPDEANEITPKASKTFKSPMLLGLSAKKQTAETASEARKDGGQGDNSQRGAAKAPTPKLKSSPFKIPAGSQQVDLTLSSDAEPESEWEAEARKAAEKSDSNDGDFLPQGPGWVQKRRTTRVTGSSQSQSSGSQRRQRRQRRQTMF